jgi:osmotically-inducible protein OsmY
VTAEAAHRLQVRTSSALRLRLRKDVAMKTALAICGVVSILLTGCTQTNDRGKAEDSATAGDRLTDDSLRDVVKARLQSDANVRKLNLDVAADAEHRAVELQGLAYTEAQRSRAVELARSARADIAVQDKIEVKPYEIPRDLFDDQMMADVKADAGRMGDKLGDSLDDGWLHMKVVAKLAADTQTPERTINVDVADKVVTLRGTVPSRESRERAESVARSVSGVTEVKNDLAVKR